MWINSRKGRCKEDMCDMILFIKHKNRKKKFILFEVRIIVSVERKTKVVTKRYLEDNKFCFAVDSLCLVVYYIHSVRTSLAVKLLRLHLHGKRARTRSLIRDLRSHKPAV